MAGESCAQATAATSGGAARSGEDVYNTYCFACHTAGVAGAPRLGIAEDWAPRLDKGLDTLFATTLSGLNAMPAKGTCMDCSDDELRAAVDHMLPQ
jgi:cytochrome c5